MSRKQRCVWSFVPSLPHSFTSLPLLHLLFSPLSLAMFCSGDNSKWSGSVFKELEGVKKKMREENWEKEETAHKRYGDSDFDNHLDLNCRCEVKRGNGGKDKTGGEGGKPVSSNCAAFAYLAMLKTSKYLVCRHCGKISRTCKYFVCIM